MNCPKCSTRLKWDEGAYCTRCMFEASTYKPPVAPPPASPEPSTLDKLFGAVPDMPLERHGGPSCTDGVCSWCNPPASPEPLGGPVLPGQSGVPVYSPWCPRCRAIGKRCGICMHYVEQQQKRDAASPAPMPERVDGWWWDGRQYRRVDPHDEEMSLDTVRCLLKLAGLHIVDAASAKDAQRLADDAREWSEQWRAAAIAWQEWAEKLLSRLGLQWKNGVMGDRVARATIEAELARRAEKGDPVRHDSNCRVHGWGGTEQMCDCTRRGMRAV